MKSKGGGHIWLKISQDALKDDEGYDLRMDKTRLLRINGRILGYDPIFIPRNGTLGRRDSARPSRGNWSWGSKLNHCENTRPVLDTKTA